MKPIPPKQKASINGQARWFRVLEPLSSLGTVFAYNRPGIGGSGKPVVPQTGEVIVESLRALLLHANLAPPFPQLTEPEVVVDAVRFVSARQPPS